MDIAAPFGTGVGSSISLPTDLSQWYSPTGNIRGPLGPVTTGTPALNSADSSHALFSEVSQLSDGVPATSVQNDIASLKQMDKGPSQQGHGKNIPPIGKAGGDNQENRDDDAKPNGSTDLTASKPPGRSEEGE